ncbi:MAG: SH3 domain-containing protein [Aggregatilineales bacterium]
MFRLVWLSLFLLLSLGLSITSARQSCTLLVRRALQAIGDNCAQLGRNFVCYGNDQVRASFLEDVDDDFFTRPADIARLNAISTVTTASLSPDDSAWGVAVMSVQANVPDTLPGQAVTFLLLGDAEIENAAEPADDTPRLNIPVTARVNSNLRSGPSTRFNRIGSARAGEALVADALSVDRQWVRIVQGSLAGWMIRTNLNADPAIDSLSVADPEQRGVMQSFFLRSGIGEPTCADVPQQALVVQGPSSFEVNLTVNGARVNIGSTVMFRTIEEDTLLEITVLDGRATVLPDIPNGQTTIIPAGFRSFFCLDDPDDRGTDGESNDKLVTCNGTPPRPIPPSEIRGSLCVLQEIAATPLNYPIDLVCPGDPAPPRPAGGTTGAAPSPTSTPSPQACNVVMMVGPYDTVGSFGQYFQWMEVPGADRYELRIYDINFTEVFRVDAGRVTAAFADPASITPEAFIYYEVFAFQEDRTLCTTGRIGGLLIRERAPQPVANTGFTFTATCSSLVTVSWSGAQPGDIINWTIDVQLPDTFPPPASGVLATLGASGTETIASPDTYCAGQTVLVELSTSSGASANRLVTCGLC